MQPGQQAIGGGRRLEPRLVQQLPAGAIEVQGLGVQAQALGQGAADLHIGLGIARVPDAHEGRLAVLPYGPGLGGHGIQGRQPAGLARRRPAKGGARLALEFAGLLLISSQDAGRQIERKADDQAAQQDEQKERQGQHPGQIVQIQQAPRRLVRAETEEILEQAHMDQQPRDDHQQPDHAGQTDQQQAQATGLQVQRVVEAVEEVPALAARRFQ